jgi:hypothetical protein
MFDTQINNIWQNKKKYQKATLRIAKSITQHNNTQHSKNVILSMTTLRKMTWNIEDPTFKEKAKLSIILLGIMAL